MKLRNDSRGGARRRACVMAMAFVLCGAVAGAARADEVRLRNGRTLEIVAHRVDGQQVRLTIEGGGEMVLPVSQILEIRRTPVHPAPAPALALQAAELQPSDAPGLHPLPGVATPVPSDRDGLRTMAAGIARRHAVDEGLVLAVIEVESHYDVRALSPRGAVGLMQLMPQTASRFDVRDPYDPAENVDGGVRYLKELLDRYSGQVRLVLAAYNAGEEAVEKHSGIPPYRETIQYVGRVLKALPR